MNDFDKVVLVYRYFFYNEVYYAEKVKSALDTCKKKSATVDDYNRLVRAMIEQEAFSKIMSDILKLFNPRHFD